MRRAVLALSLLMASCNSPVFDPTLRPYTWQPEAANTVNLAAMAADPRDLARGRGESGNDGQIAARAIRRWRLAPVRLLANGGQGGGAASGGGGAAAGGSAGQGTGAGVP